MAVSSQISKSETDAMTPKSAPENRHPRLALVERRDCWFIGFAGHAQCRVPVAEIGRPATCECSEPNRKPRRGRKIVAQGKRSAALGGVTMREYSLSPRSDAPVVGLARRTVERGELLLGLLTQGGSRCAPLSWATGDWVQPDLPLGLVLVWSEDLGRRSRVVL